MVGGGGCCRWLTVPLGSFLCMASVQEAEERVAEMGEEMMAYLDEITMLKTKVRATKSDKLPWTNGWTITSVACACL